MVRNKSSDPVASGFSLIQPSSKEGFLPGDSCISAGNVRIADFTKISPCLKIASRQLTTFDSRKGRISLALNMTTKVKEGKFLGNYSKELIHQIEYILDLSLIAQYYPNHDETQRSLELIEDCAKRLTCHIRQLEDFTLNAFHSSGPRIVSAPELIEIVNQEIGTQPVYRDVALTMDLTFDKEEHLDIELFIKILKYLINEVRTYPVCTLEVKMIAVQIAYVEQSIEMEIHNIGFANQNTQKTNSLEFSGYKASPNLLLARHLAEQIGATVSIRMTPAIGLAILAKVPCQMHIR